MTSPTLRLVSLGLVVLTSAGCVARSQYDRLVTEYHSENQARVQLESELARAEAENSELRSQLQEANSARNAATSRVGELEGELAAARTEAEQAMLSIPDVEVFDTRDGFAFRMASELLFDSGSDQVKDSGKTALNQIAKEIISKGYQAVRIDGHTDTDPVVVTREQYPLGNHQLAAQRALAVFGYLTNQGGVSDDVFTLASFGPNNPTVSGSTAEAKAKNRRVEIHVKVGG